MSSRLSQETLNAMINAQSQIGSGSTQPTNTGVVFPPVTQIEQSLATNKANTNKIKEIEHKLLIILMVRAGISGLGTIGGWIYANRTGGGFWRYVGFGLMGGMAFGTLSFIATIPTYSKLDAELKNLK